MKVMLEPGAFAPTRAYQWDAGLDLYSPVDAVVPARGSVAIDTGVHVAIPHYNVGMVKSKSGLLFKHDITTVGVVDSSYRGTIRVKMMNHSDRDYQVKRGDKISQLVIMPIELEDIIVVDSLDETDRGENGFGSTGT